MPMKLPASMANVKISRATSGLHHFYFFHRGHRITLCGHMAEIITDLKISNEINQLHRRRWCPRCLQARRAINERAGIPDLGPEPVRVRCPKCGRRKSARAWGGWIDCQHCGILDGDDEGIVRAVHRDPVKAAMMNEEHESRQRERAARQ